MPRKRPVASVPHDPERWVRAVEAYQSRFGVNMGIPPFGVSEDAFAEVLEEAVAKGQPVPDDFDWYWWMPPDAMA